MRGDAWVNGGYLWECGRKLGEFSREDYDSYFLGKVHGAANYKTEGNVVGLSKNEGKVWKHFGIATKIMQRVFRFRILMMLETTDPNLHGVLFCFLILLEYS